MSVLKYKKLSSNAFAPRRAYPTDSGLDLRAAHGRVVPGGGVAIIYTDLQIEIPPGWYGRIAPRSGNAANYMVGVGGGVVDRNFQGNVGVIIFNHSPADFLISRGDAVAQLILEACLLAEPLEDPNLGNETEEDASRRDRGFGSSGK